MNYLHIQHLPYNIFYHNASTLLKLQPFLRESFITHPHFLRFQLRSTNSLTFERRKYYIRIEKFEVSRFTVFRVISNTNLAAVLLTRLFTQPKTGRVQKGQRGSFRSFPASPLIFFLAFPASKTVSIHEDRGKPSLDYPRSRPVSGCALRDSRAIAPPSLPPFQPSHVLPLVRTSKGINVRFHVTMGVTTFDIFFLFSFPRMCFDVQFDIVISYNFQVYLINAIL